jgi:hypothetical protein
VPDDWLCCWLAELFFVGTSCDGIGSVAKNEIKKLLLGCGVADTSNTLWGETSVVAFFVSINSLCFLSDREAKAHLQNQKSPPFENTIEPKEPNRFLGKNCFYLRPSTSAEPQDEIRPQF